MDRIINKITLGDCYDYISRLPSKSVDLIIADPPYVTTKESWDRKDDFNFSHVKHLYRVLKDTGSFYLWCGVGERSSSYDRWKPICCRKFHFKDMITWKKQRGLGMRKGWLYTSELCLWFTKTTTTDFMWNEEFQYSDEKRSRDWDNRIRKSQNGYKPKSIYKRLTNVWIDIVEESFAISNKNKDKIKHYTPKPKKAIDRIIRVHTKEGDLVLDPYSGSGTTAIVASNLHRDFIAIEKDEIIWKDSLDRYKEET